MSKKKFSFSFFFLPGVRVDIVGCLYGNRLLYLLRKYAILIAQLQDVILV